MMAPLASRLRQAGFATVNWGYRSLWGDIQAFGRQLRSALEELASETEGPLHVVAHSMGSLVTRQALLGPRLAAVDRIVLLCPPNRGSAVASRLSVTWGRFSRPLVQLCDHPQGFAAQLSTSLTAEYQVGILAAERDFVVSLESTRLPGATHHRQVPGLHSSMLFRQETADYIIRYLQHGEM